MNIQEELAKKGYYSLRYLEDAHVEIRKINGDEKIGSLIPKINSTKQETWTEMDSIIKKHETLC